MLVLLFVDFYLRKYVEIHDNLIPGPKANKCEANIFVSVAWHSNFARAKKTVPCMSDHTWQETNGEMNARTITDSLFTVERKETKHIFRP